jgi:hypothetical protein
VPGHYVFGMAIANKRGFKHVTETKSASPVQSNSCFAYHSSRNKNKLNGRST